MKKLLALVLVLVLCVSFLVACDPKETISSVTGSIKDKVGNVTSSIKDKINSLLGKEPDKSDEKTALDSAVAYVFDLYREKASETPANYDLVSVVTIDGVAFTVTWTTDNELITIVPHAEDENLVTVVVPAADDEDVPYVLTATVEDADGNSKSKSFDRVVPKFKVLTAAEYYAAEKGSLVVVEGIVTGIASKSQGSYNTLYLDDLKGEGGYYIYSFADKDSDLINDLGIKIGMTVRVSGTKDIFSGTHEVKDSAVEIIDSTVKPITPVDYTEIFKNATDLKDEALVGKQGMLVTLKGVTVGDVGDNGYRHFTLGALTSYVRISSSSNCMSKDDVTKFEADFVANKGNTADVTGVISVYDGKFYLIPVSVDAYKNFATPDRNDAEKVEFEKGNIKLPTEIKVDTELDLPVAGSVYDKVLISWKSDNACAVVENGKLKVTLPDEAVTVTLTATISINDVKKDVEFKIAVSEKPTVVPSAVTELVEKKAYKLFYYQVNKGGVPYYFNGTKGDYYGNMTDVLAEAVDIYIENAEGGFYIYFEDAANENAKTYIEVYTSDSGYVNLKFNTETPATVFVMDADYGLPVVTVKKNDVDTKHFLGTYGDKTDLRPSIYDDYITSDTNCFAKICELIDANSISAEDKVATEKAGVDIKKTEFTEDGTLTLPTTPAVYDDVTITWTVDGEPVANNVINIVLGREEQTITLLATIKCGDATETKEFTVKVAKKPVIQIEEVTSLEVGVAYKFYLNQVKNGEKLYFNGNPESASVTYRLETTNAVGKALDVYLEYAYAEDGTTVLGYRIYFFKDEVKTYIRMYERTKNTAGDGSGSLEYVTETPAEYYTYHETFKTLILTCVATDSTEDAPKYNTYYLGAYSDYDTIRVSNTSYINDNNLETSGGQYPTHFATFYCLHDYTSDCDVECNECGAARTDAAEHTFAGDCDAICDVCGATRETSAEHTYEKACSETCTVCGFVRDGVTHTAAENALCTADVLCAVCDKKLADAKADHAAAEDDGDCTTAVKCTNEYCTHTVTAGAANHTFEGCEGTDCTVEGCDVTRVAPGHQYENDCDQDCNGCGEANPNASSDHVDNVTNATGEAGKDGQCDNCGFELDEAGDTEFTPV